jgi:hypothetical protein
VAAVNGFARNSIPEIAFPRCAMTGRSSPRSPDIERRVQANAKS